MRIVDNTFRLQREVLYKHGVITESGTRSTLIKRKSDGGGVYDTHDVVWLYVNRPAGLLNWYGRKLCGMVDINERKIYIWKYYNECYKILEHLTFFEDYVVEIQDSRKY